MRDSDDQEPRERRDTTRRKVLAASSGIGGAAIGLTGLTGQVAAEGDQLTEDELVSTLQESRHVGFKPEYADRREALLNGVDAVRELDESVTVGEDHPDVYFGEFANARPPSGEYYAITEPGAWRERDGSLVRKDEDLTVGGELGCFSIRGVEVCAIAEAGIEFTAGTDLQFGGELFLDVGFEALGQEVTVSLAGFGFSVGPGDNDGYCYSPKVNLPSYLPEGTVDLCGYITLETRYGGDEIRFGVGVTGLEVCADPCPVISCEVCGTAVSGSVQLNTPWIDTPNI